MVVTAKDSPTVLALTFDGFGTLIDWDTGLRQAFQEEGVLDSLKTPWPEFRKAREKREAEWQALPYRHYREILAISLREAFSSFGANLDEPTALRISDSIRRWPPFEDTVSALGGHKSLYSTVHYPAEEFWRRYNGPVYEELKAAYDPYGRLPDLYDKVSAKE